MCGEAKEWGKDDKKKGQTRTVAGSSGVILAMVVGKGCWPPWYASDPVYQRAGVGVFRRAKSIFSHSCRLHRRMSTLYSKGAPLNCVNSWDLLLIALALGSLSNIVLALGISS